MTNDKGIFIKNIYYMLAYAYQVLRQSNYDDINKEAFENIEDLFAAILSKGIAQQLKQGLHKEYVSRQDSLPLLRGKLDIQNTIKNRINKRRVLSCEFDEFSENNIFNQILKTCADVLIRSDSVKPEHKASLRQVMQFFNGVDLVDPFCIHWSLLKFQSHNRSYPMLMNICRFVLEGLLLTTEKGRYRMAVFSDERMEDLYERFVFEYYRRHRPDLNPNRSEVAWNMDEGSQKGNLLPRMRPDVTLIKDGKTLIIDTKYYSNMTQSNRGSQSIHSGNLYQIFAYVKNADKERSGNVSGMLLYARTNEDVVPDEEYLMDGNSISAKTLDLNVDFNLITKQLDNIAENAFGPLLN